MNKQFYIRKLLNCDQLSNIDNFIKNANQNDSWTNGLNSTLGMNKDVKNNHELCDQNLVFQINSIIMNCLDNDSEFINYTAAKSTITNIVSKTISGGYYKPHLDFWTCGDYSTTVFLNSPDEYSGGELCLFLNEEEKKIKLDKGYAITYPTGILHRVNRVVSGCRYVSVFWTKSLIRDEFIREVHYELCKALNTVESKSIHHTTCNSISNDTFFILDNLKNQILRKYSNTGDS
jgi:PKHD-type hydroxylase